MGGGGGRGRGILLTKEILVFVELYIWGSLIFVNPPKIRKLTSLTMLPSHFESGWCAEGHAAGWRFAGSA